MAFKYNGVTLINDSRELTNISSFDDSTTNILTSNLSSPTKSLTLYADSSARSKVANAVRRGVAAHELDDEKDEY